MNKCAFDNEHNCTALNKMKCRGCSFRKTKEELAEGRQKAEKHIRTLPKDIQMHIQRKYYACGNSR